VECPLRVKAEVGAEADNVRSAPESGHHNMLSVGPLSAMKRLMHRSKTVVFSSCQKVRPRH
jgi:hypothetical protein